jgi:hypothetical protein
MQVGAALYYGDGAILEIADHVRALAANTRSARSRSTRGSPASSPPNSNANGLIVSAFPQHDARMVTASAGLHRPIVDRRLTLPDDSELARHARNAIAKHGRRGWRLDKPSPRTHSDGVIALDDETVPRLRPTLERVPLPPVRRDVAVLQARMAAISRWSRLATAPACVVAGRTASQRTSSSRAPRAVGNNLPCLPNPEGHDSIRDGRATVHSNIDAQGQPHP